MTEPCKSCEGYERRITRYKEEVKLKDEALIEKKWLCKCHAKGFVKYRRKVAAILVNNRNLKAGLDKALAMKIPNKETRKAIDDANKGRVTKAKDADDMFKKLGIK